VTFPGVGHLAQEEIPDRVAEEVLRFLTVETRAAAE
jgi:pimeloyl-ACP methyl ester carboxylesterase